MYSFRPRILFSLLRKDAEETLTLMMDIYQQAKERKFIMLDKTIQLSGFADEIDNDFEKQITVLKECGISYMELRSAYGKNISEYSIAEAQKLKDVLDQNKIKVSAIGSPIGKIGIKDDFEEHFKLFCHVVALAKLFETDYIRMFSFYIPEGEIAEDYKAAVFERLKRMIDYAKDSGIVLLHENEKGIYGDISCRCKEMMDVFYCDNFKAIFDFANFVQCNQDTMDAFLELKPYIAYIHVKDALRASHQVVPAGFGDGQVIAIVKQLNNAKFVGFYSLEPHLTLFDGLQQLERKSDKTVMGMDLKDGRSAFLTAHHAFQEILKGE